MGTSLLINPQSEIRIPKSEGERVSERARMDARRRVDDHAGGLVDDDYLLVLVDDVERDLFGREFRRRRRGQLDLDALARPQLVRRLRRAPADEHVAVLDRALERRAAHALDPRGEECVEARARVLLGGFESERPGFRLGERSVDYDFPSEVCELVITE